jgi:cytochrome P450
VEAQPETRAEVGRRRAGGVGMSTKANADPRARVRVEIDFDHHSPDYARRWREISDRNLAQCPVAHTEAHGGFWLLSDYESVRDAARDDASFSSFHDVTGEGNGYQGIVIPPSPILQIPIELDPPEFTEYRQVLNPLFSPRASRRWEPDIRAITTACIDRFCASGEGDLIEQLGSPVPAVLTMKMLGLPLSDWERYSRNMHEITYLMADPEAFQPVVETFMGLIGEVVQTIGARRKEPRDDLISALVQAEINGAPISDEQVTSICTLIIAGGVDTTTSLFATTLDWLDRHPDARRRLIDEPELLPTATEEFLRYFCPQQMLARTATRDIEVGGQLIGEGERVMLSWAAANRDATAFEDPDEVRLDRSPNRHTTFGLGLHRCLGSNIARLEFGIMLSELLRRLPDFRIDRDHAEPYPSIGVVNGWIRMPAHFTPSPSECSDAGLF